MEEFQIFVKPVGSACNLNCSYCYYINSKEVPEVSSFPAMKAELLEIYIKHHFDASSDDVVMFSWHGGEPLLAGMNFYRKAVELQKKHNIKGKRIINGIQTNGTLIDNEWCRFFRDENFIIGLSIDGPEEFHNANRVNSDGRGSWSGAVRGARLLREYGLSAEILCVVNSHNSGHPLEIYNFIKSVGARYITFLPLVIRDPGSPGSVSAGSVRPEDFGKFLMTIFDEWKENDIGEIQIQIFEEALRSAFGQEHTLCIFKPECGKVPVLEHNGNFYTCDHFVNRENLIGNIVTASVKSLLEDEKLRQFGRNKKELLPEYCLKCEVLEMCNGECPKNRFINTPDGEPRLNYLCSGYRHFFNHCRPFIASVRDAWMSNLRIKL